MSNDAEGARRPRSPRSTACLTRSSAGALTTTAPSPLTKPSQRGWPVGANAAACERSVRTTKFRQGASATTPPRMGLSHRPRASGPSPTGSWASPQSRTVSGWHHQQYSGGAPQVAYPHLTSSQPAGANFGCRPPSTGGSRTQSSRRAQTAAPAASPSQSTEARATTDRERGDDVSPIS